MADSFLGDEVAIVILVGVAGDEFLLLVQVADGGYSVAGIIGQLTPASISSFDGGHIPGFIVVVGCHLAILIHNLGQAV